MDVCVSVWVYAFMWVQWHRKSEEGTRFSGAGVRTYLRDATWMLGLALLISWQSGRSLLLRHLSKPFLLVLVSIFLLCISEMLLLTCGNTYNYLNGELFSVLQQLSAHLWVFIFFNWETGLLTMYFLLFVYFKFGLFVWDSVSNPATCQHLWNATQHWKQKVDWTVNSVMQLPWDHHPCWGGTLMWHNCLGFPPTPISNPSSILGKSS